ncbi:MAG: Gfo/Idh/MocA family oxidoreductase [Candidatus Hydrogenedentes bacterium]|nr:Gfo/Idh/MocA family oxidoreductase [Candidatus Hydrogenedentota bacterium]
MTKIGIMSFAHLHAHSYASALNELPEAELAGLWDDDAARGQAMAKQYGTRFEPGLDAFLQSDIQGVIICSENVKHREMAERAAEAGKWILCEKPLAPTVADAKAILAACKKAGVGLGTAFPCRYVPSLMVVRDQLASGEYGEIYAASCTNHGQNPGGWFNDPQLAGGGAVMDHTVHVVDLLRWMTGREFVDVYCVAGNQLHGEGFPTDDIGSLHLTMDGGVQISHLASWSRPKSFPTWGDVTMEIICEKGVITVDAFNQKVNVFDDKAGRLRWAPWGDNADLGLVRDFVRAVETKTEPAITGVDGLRATEVSVAAYKSIESGRRVNI